MTLAYLNEQSPWGHSRSGLLLLTYKNKHPWPSATFFTFHTNGTQFIDANSAKTWWWFRYSYSHQRVMGFPGMWKTLYFILLGCLVSPPPTPPHSLPPFLPSMGQGLGVDSEQEPTEPSLWWSSHVNSENYTVHVSPGLTRVFSRQNRALQFIRYVYCNACI